MIEAGRLKFPEGKANGSRRMLIALLLYILDCCADIVCLRARTFMRLSGGNIRLLAADEPTSALDPEGEFELFSKLRNQRDGKTIVFITHRFGHLTRFADLIL